MFIEVYKEFRSKYAGRARTKKAIRDTINYYMDNNFISNTIRKWKAEILGMIFMDFNKRTYDRTLREEGYEAGKFETEKKSVRIIIGLVEEFSGSRQTAEQIAMQLYPEHEGLIKELLTLYWE